MKKFKKYLFFVFMLFILFFYSFCSKEEKLNNVIKNGNITEINELLKSGNKLTKQNIIEAFKSGNYEIIQRIYAEKPTESFTNEEIISIIPFLNKHTFVIFSSIAKLSPSNNSELIDICLKNNKYDLAAYLINYSSGNFINEIDAIAVLSKFLSTKSYAGDKQKYTEADVTISSELESAAEQIGLSKYVILKNEILARKGYIFKTPMIARIFEATAWYEPRPNITQGSLSEIENINIVYILKKEESVLYGILINWLENKDYSSETVFNQEQNFKVPENVMNVLHHFRVNPSLMLRAEIYARNGFVFKDQFYKKIFDKISWYKPQFENIDIKKVTDVEKANLTLLQFREWIEIIDSYKNTTPNDIETIPVLAYNTLFLKKINYNNQTYYLSTHDLNYAISINSDIFNKRGTENDGISDQIKNEIINETNPRKALIKYFENKKYYGYMDKQVLTLDQMEPPSYLKSALLDLKIEWTILLKKEIHARHGAFFTDPLTGPIFSGCSWYSPKYNLTTSTISRLPGSEKINEIEILNFCLLEGKDLGDKKEKNKDSIIVCDLNGNTYYLKIEKIMLNSLFFYSAFGFIDINEFKNRSVEDKIKDILRNNDIIFEIYREEYNYEFTGC